MPSRNPRRSGPFPRAAVLSLVALASALPSPSILAQNSAQVQTALSFAIPAQPLSDALADFTAQARAQVTLAPGLRSGGLSSTAVQGTFSAEEALRRLLAGTGFEARRTGSDFIVDLPPSVEEQVRRQPIQQLIVIGQPIDTVLTSRDLDRRQANDLDDIFSGIPSVMAGGSIAAAQKLYVRNLGEDTLNVMVDGATQAGVTYHHTGRISIEPELLEQVAVQVGAGEATNGPGALGGAIRFATKDPENLLEPGERVGALLKSGYFSNSGGHKLSTTVYGQLNDSLGLLASLVRSDHDLIEDGHGLELPGTQSEQELGFLKGVGRLGADHKLSLSYEQLTEEGEKTRRPEWSPGPGNPLDFLEFQRRTATLNHAWTPTASELLALETTLYRTEFDIFRPSDRYTSQVASNGLLLRNTSVLGDHELIYGLDYREDEVTAGEADFASAERERSSVRGFYLQDHHTLSPTLLLSYGLRFDDYQLDDNDGGHFGASGFSPNLGFSWQASDRLGVSGGYASALRGPETNDGFKLFGTSNDPDLEAEEARNLELGLDYELGAFLLSAGVHDVVIDGAIGNAVPWSRHYQNLGDLESSGYTLKLGYLGARLNAELSYVSTKAELNGEELTRYAYGYLGTSAGNSLGINLAWLLTPGLELGWIGQVVQGIDDIHVRSAEGFVDKPGYGVHDLYAQWQPTAVPQLSLTLTVKNAFDKYYLDHGSIEDFRHLPDYETIVGGAAPGRDIRVTAAFRF